MSKVSSLAADAAKHPRTVDDARELARLRLIRRTAREADLDGEGQRLGVDPALLRRARRQVDVCADCRDRGAWTEPGLCRFHARELLAGTGDFCGESGPSREEAQP